MPPQRRLRRRLSPGYLFDVARVREMRHDDGKGVCQAGKGSTPYAVEESQRQMMADIVEYVVQRCYGMRAMYVPQSMLRYTTVQRYHAGGYQSCMR